MSDGPITADSIPTEIKGWADLATLVERFSYFSDRDWLYRGVINKDYQLIPKIGRAATRASKVKQQLRYNSSDETSIIEMFKKQAMPYLPSLPRSEIEWLAIAQHHGLPTRFIDWTESLLVAAWFAVERPDGDADSAIWVTREIPAVRDEDFDNPLTIHTPRSYRPPHINSRIAAQASVLVVCPEPEEALQPAFVRKIVIPNRAMFTIKKRLNACGVNRRLLFPDLAGLCDHLAWLYRHDWLSGYRQEVDGLLAFAQPMSLDLPPNIQGEEEDPSEHD